MKQSAGERVFSVLNCIFLGAFGFLCVYPFIYMVSVSISDVFAVQQGKVWLLPNGFNLSSYQRVIKDSGIWMAYGNSLVFLVAGTAVNILFTVCAAYPLSRKRLMGRKFFTFYIALTMWFTVPMIPFYLTIKSLNLYDTRSAIIFGFAVSAFYVIVLKTFFDSIPESLEESAKIDGANDLTILTKIMLPLSVPALATITIYYAVSRWNGYFWTMILIKDEKKVPLQLYLRKLIIEVNLIDMVSLTGDYGSIIPETFVYATIIVAVIPMVIVYPLIQKYFVKGMMIGSIKG